LQTIKAIGLLITGFIIVPILDLITPRSEMLRWRFLDHIYGNRIDGIVGDEAYCENEAKRWYARFWPRTWWCAFRNPINNYLRSLGPYGRVEGVKEYHSGRFHRIDATIGGEEYHMCRYRLFGSVYWQWGYNLLNDDRTDSRLEPLWHFENRMLLPWFKKLKG